MTIMVLVCPDGLRNKGDDKLYQHKDRVSYSRVDTQGKLKVHAIVNALQDCCLFHSEEVGQSCMELKKDSYAWLVNTWHVVIKQRPSMGEEFVVKTWPYKFRGVFGMRNFLLENAAGEVMAYADSQWFYFNHETGTPARPTKEAVEPFGLEEAYPMEHKPRKVVYPDDLTYRDTICVCSNHLDTNEHVNNGEYVRMAADYLPVGYEVTELRVEYRLAAKLGDKIQIHTKEEEENYYVVMTDDKLSPYVITCFTKERV